MVKMCARHSARFIFPYFSDSSDENAPPERFHLRPILSNRYAVSELHGLGRRSVVAQAPPRDLVPPTTKAHAKTERVILSAKRSGAVELRAEAMERCGRIAPCGISFPSPQKPSGRGTREPLPRYSRARPRWSPHKIPRRHSCRLAPSPPARSSLLAIAHAQDDT